VTSASWGGAQVVLGRVVCFDEGSGLGVIELAADDVESDGQRVPFHCVSLVDGSRAVEIGRPVAFVPRLGRDGRRWAAGVVKLGD